MYPKTPLKGAITFPLIRFKIISPFFTFSFSFNSPEISSFLILKVYLTIPAAKVSFFASSTMMMDPVTRLTLQSSTNRGSGLFSDDLHIVAGIGDVEKGNALYSPRKRATMKSRIIRFRDYEDQQIYRKPDCQVIT